MDSGFRIDCGQQTLDGPLGFILLIHDSVIVVINVIVVRFGLLRRCSSEQSSTDERCKA